MCYFYTIVVVFRSPKSTYNLTAYRCILCERRFCPLPVDSAQLSGIAKTQRLDEFILEKLNTL